MWDLMEGATLCDGYDPERESYTLRAHLAQFIGLLGPPPKEFLDQMDKEEVARYFLNGK
jgi:serine/threonine-protein kinase SRPK3